MRLITESGKIIPVSDKQVIGRDLFKSKIVSKAHGLLWLEGNSIFYKDTGSLHGSFLVDCITGQVTQLTPEPVKIESGFKLQLSKRLKIRDKIFKPVTVTVKADSPSNVFSADLSDISENLDHADNERETSVNNATGGSFDDEESKYYDYDDEGEHDDDYEVYYPEPNQTIRSGNDVTNEIPSESSTINPNSLKCGSDLLLRSQIAHLEDQLTAQSSTLDSLAYDLKEIRLESIKSEIINKRLQIAKRKEAFRFARIRTNKLKKSKSSNFTDKTVNKPPAEYKQNLTAGIVGGALGVSLGAAATITFLLNLN
ncbi:hypothetical protein J056_002369 [Wallemia ichthyophaga EXF-994]|uniref:FHA domain-containing protein n=1 Tax=Wallemia ichthyophaga (strain EXF-994 / CBS 113033) TaxID=1299270 RepID=R9AB05_WALI9|nr:uncharacterized protein J056_002369 [Wallemia ichthyophaga EXF-994]EOQ99244.1 hypothetical protein J056_002369 [Wallemia ichthyophaga EXF-994]